MLSYKIKTRLLLMVVFLCIVILSPSVFALSKNQVALGGIQLDASLIYVNSIYGYPRKIESNGYFWKSYYGNGFVVESSSRRDEPQYKRGEHYVDQITVTQNNGITTPDGAYVGMKEDSIEKIYGEPFCKGSFENNTNTYMYFAGTELLSFVARNGVVTEIRICETD